MRWFVLVVFVSCSDAPLAALGEPCLDDGGCASGVCIEQACVAADGDFDGDGLSNGDEVALGLDPSTDDSDRDGVLDGDEVGHDSDGDGRDDALEDRLGDRDGDCLDDEHDPDDQRFDPRGCVRARQLLAVAFLPGLNVVVCAGEYGELGLNSLEVTGDTFDVAWMSNLRVRGTLVGDALSATLTCDTHTGTLEATRVGSHYEGSFTFGEHHGLMFAAVADEAYGVSYYGVVTRDGEQVAGAAVRVALDPSALTYSQADGHFFLETAIDPGMHDGQTTTLSVTAPGTELVIEVPITYGMLGVYTALTRTR